MTIKMSVFEALDNAIENGYDMRQLSVEKIVTELMTYDADLENADEIEIKSAVQEWLSK